MDESKKLIKGEMLLKINHKNKRFYNYDNFFSDTIFSQYLNIEDDFNIEGYRSDNFIKKHDGLHILFLGCSVTHGDGLSKDEVWSFKLLKLINEKTKCSGYFNLSISGNSISNQIINFFKYCKNYGNPNVVFFNMPDLSRFYYYDIETKNIGDGFLSFKDEQTNEFIKIFNYQYYLMLDQYCKSNNIKLFSFTWNDTKKDIDKFKEFYITSFDSFYSLDQKDINKFILQYANINKNDKNSIIARDNSHFGTAYHEYWAQKMYSLYLQVT